MIEAEGGGEVTWRECVEEGYLYIYLCRGKGEGRV